MVSSALQTIGSSPSSVRPVWVLGTPDWQASTAGTWTSTPLSLTTLEVAVGGVEVPLLQVLVLEVDWTSCASATTGTPTLATLASPVAIWQVPSLAMLPSELAASIGDRPRPRAPNATPRVSKWLIEPVAVVAELATTACRQTPAVLQMLSSTPVWSALSGPLTGGCPGVVSMPRISFPSSDRIVMWPW
ncbi:MAG: hypothetical protein DLM64_00580 [Solirubrobacterales bacterium]|nr:MAG: hypothetical protein DLM64_00580 [Solirubrobacterales bacterium]